MTAIIAILLAVIVVLQIQLMVCRRLAQNALRAGKDYIDHLKAANNRWHTVSLELAVQLDLERRRGLQPPRLPRPRGGRS